MTRPDDQRLFRIGRVNGELSIVDVRTHPPNSDDWVISNTGAPFHEVQTALEELLQAHIGTAMSRREEVNMMTEEDVPDGT